jgi:hypothetical protein
MEYRGNFIAGSYLRRTKGLKEGWWYTWDYKIIRKATKTERRAGAGIN